MPLTKRLLIPVIFLYAMGLVMIFNTSSADILDHALTKGTHIACAKQLCYGVLGALVAFICYTIGWRSLIQLSPNILAFLSFLLILVFIPGIGIKANGSRRWIGFMGFSLQPSEFVKYIVPAYYIYYASLRKDMNLTVREFTRLLAILGVPLFLILIEPNNGTVGVIGLELIVLFFLTKVPSKLWALPVAVIICIGGIFAVNLPYVRARLEVYMNPEKDLKGKGHQPHQAKIASGSGGVFGKGPGKSIQKLSYLPEAQNDYIAAIFAEEYGFVGILVLLASYGWLATLGFTCAIQAKDSSAYLLASIISFLLTFQAFMNLGVVSGLLPSTGLNLPFFSQGGSSLMANLGGIGVLMNIASEEKSGNANTTMTWRATWGKLSS